MSKIKMSVNRQPLALNVTRLLSSNIIFCWELVATMRRNEEFPLSWPFSSPASRSVVDARVENSSCIAGVCHDQKVVLCSPLFQHQGCPPCPERTDWVLLDIHYFAACLSTSTARTCALLPLLPLAISSARRAILRLAVSLRGRRGVRIVHRNMSSLAASMSRRHKYSFEECSWLFFGVAQDARESPTAPSRPSMHCQCLEYTIAHLLVRTPCFVYI